MYLLILSFITLISFVFINLLAGRFSDSDNLLQSPVIEFVVMYILVCFSYFLFVTKYIKQTAYVKNLTILIFMVGFLIRLLMVYSSPILEDDYYRYLWDGAVLANGYNPYQYAPDEFKGYSYNGEVPVELTKLAESNRRILDNINHPQLKTVYPPVAELSFALAYLVKPFSLISWKAVLLIFDIITFILLLLLLKRLKIPEWNIIIYWLNPLLIIEIFNSAHMDVVVIPFILACLLMFFHRRYIGSFSSLALAVGFKLWPILLIPILLRRLSDNRAPAIKYLGYFTFICLVILLPLINSYFVQSSGIEAYARSWQNNDSIFRVLLKFSEFILPLAGYHPGHGQLVTRIAVILIICLSTIAMIKNRVMDDKDIIRKFLIVLSVLFFLSPTQFPWYYLWLLPFLTIIPYRPLLLLTVLMPLYDLRYYFLPRGQYEYYDNLIVCLEYAPVLGWIIYDLIKNRKTSYLRLRSSAS